MSLASEIRNLVSGKVSEEEPISAHTSFRVGGPASVFVEPDSQTELASIGQVAAEYDTDILVLGRGTNLLVSDSGFPGVVIQLGKAFDWIESDGVDVSAGGFTSLPKVSNRAAKLGLSGLAFGIAIPATVGGAVRMNAGAHGSSIQDVLTSANVCDLLTGRVRDVPLSELEFEYRRSGLASSDVVCSARFALQRGEPDEIVAEMDANREHRQRTQPLDAPNAGSMFKNPTHESAGRLIENEGLKGLRVGEAEVSRKHANFFLARDGATAQDIYELMATVQGRVKSNTGILLEPEVRIAGDFDCELELVLPE